MSSETTPQELANKNITQIIYGLYLASYIIGVTWLVGIILNYVKRDDVVGSWLESHFRWQIRTFWFTLLWVFVGAITSMIIIGFFVLGFAVIWNIYRLVKGWLNLNEGKPMYPS
jgi:uncharacterized membrane protein